MPMASQGKHPATAVLQFADSEKSADVRYFGGVLVPDPFISMEIGKRKVAIVSQLEIARVRRESQFDEVLPLEEWMEKARASAEHRFRYPADVIATYARENGLERFRVAREFPAGVAFDLEDRNLEVETVDGMLFPDREFKTDEQAREIAKANAVCSQAFKIVEQVLRNAQVVNKRVLHDGRVLTCDELRSRIELHCLKKGYRAINTIVACGKDACDPHSRGSGPVRPNELIIVDIFPSSVDTGYHGDMTRTYLKGKASEAQKHLVETVRAALEKALPEHKAGASGKKIYEDVKSRFEQAGYETRNNDGSPEGFFHGLGHGLGLEVHEPPRVNREGQKLQVGQVITVEPGLYYPAIGGCRFEDVIRVQKKGPEPLSKHPYRWEIA